ncbi:Rhs core protein with extension [Escherichia coli]|uniref:Rhs core protein with extension n=1 Tax=Escherichia coli TaxID=562 RepID=A0A376P277_ECOLX|nr:Rhs core protein with extension [Escherichia coli]
MVGGRGEIKKEVDFPEAGEDTALCDKENKPPRIAQAAATSLSTISLPRAKGTNWSAVRRSWEVRRTSYWR